MAKKVVSKAVVKKVVGSVAKSPRQRFGDPRLKKRIKSIFGQVKAGNWFLKHPSLKADLAELNSVNIRMNGILRKKELTQEEIAALQKLESHTRILVKEISAKWAKASGRDVFVADPK